MNDCHTEVTSAMTGSATLRYIALVQRKPGALRNGAPFAVILRSLIQHRRFCDMHWGLRRCIF